MDALSRRESIRESIDRDGFVRLKTLSEAFGVTPVTIHRDLDQLVLSGAVERVRGGARSLSAGRHEVRNDFNSRRAQATTQKLEIAKRALAEVPDGATVFMDSSTTVYALAQQLEQEPSRNLTIVTNSPAIGYMFRAPYVHVISVPGEINQPLRAITGRWASEFLQGLSFSSAFISAAGITVDGGLMTTQRDLADLLTVAFERSQRHVALIDSSKFDTSALITFASIADLDLVVTDQGLPSAVEARYRDAGLPLVRAASNSS